MNGLNISLTSKTDSNNRILSIDIMRSLAIVSVLIIHSIPDIKLENIYASFHIWQAVPVFMVLHGFTSALSFKKHEFFCLNHNLNAIGNTKKKISTFVKDYKIYFFKKFKVIFFPFLIIFVLDCVIALQVSERAYWGPWILIGYLPIIGPGNYFITLLFQSCLVLPLIYYVFNKRPICTISALWILNFAFELLAVIYLRNKQYIYSSAVPRYFGAIAIGLWLSRKNIYSIKNNLWIFIAGIISIIWLFLYSILKFRISIFLPYWHWQNFLAFGYAGLLVMTGLQYLQVRENLFINTLKTIGKASYHIFLVQILWFGLSISGHGFTGNLGLIINTFACICLGVLYYRLMIYITTTPILQFVYGWLISCPKI